MEEALYTFEPNLSDTVSSFWLGIMTAVAGLGACLYLLKKTGSGSERNYRLLGAMLLFFVFLIGAGTAFFSWWTQHKLTPVKIYADALDTPYGTVNFKDIENAFIREERDPSLINPTLTRDRYQLLIIEETSGKMHALSEENFDLKDILEKLREAVKAWERKRE